MIALYNNALTKGKSSPNKVRLCLGKDLILF